MNFIELESPQKLRGGYYTQPDIAAFLTQWALDHQPRHMLEPSCGDGVFFDTLARLPHSTLESVVGFELDAAEAAKARRRARAIGVPASRGVHAADFLDWFLNRPADAPTFDAVIGNPPFVRYQYLDAQQQQLAERVFKRHGLHFTKHTNAWVPFVVASLALIRPGGRLAMVVPAELLHVLHARSLREFIVAQCSRVLVLDPEQISFHDTLQGVVLLLAEKRGESDRGAASIAIQPMSNRRQLAEPAAELFARAEFFPATVLNGKWMVGLLSRTERTLLAQIEQSPNVRRFGDIADVDVGIVTGANKFFLVTDAVVDEYKLHRWAHPMFGRSDHVRGVIYDMQSHEENKRLALPTNFLWFGSTPFDELSAGAKRYIRSGEAEGLPKRYKCRIRSPWYAVPSVSASPVGMLKRCNHFPRLILNQANAFTTDTAYRVKPNALQAVDLVASFVNSLTALSAELEGRHYGGGVLELVPSEIEKLLLPATNPAPTALLALDQAVRNGMPPEELLARQDESLLLPVGITQRECESLQAAWLRLRDRRQRNVSADPVR